MCHVCLYIKCNGISLQPNVNIIKALLAANTWTSGPDLQHCIPYRVIPALLCVYIWEYIYIWGYSIVCICLNIPSSVGWLVRTNDTSHLCLPLLSHRALDNWAAWLCPSSSSNPSLLSLEGLRQLDWTGDQCWGNSLIMVQINDEKFGVIQ